MRQISRRTERPILFCTLCGQEIITGEEYWYCNGNLICADCLSAFARTEFAPYRHTHGKEAGI